MSGRTPPPGQRPGPRRVLLVEQNPIGHHFYYVRLLVDAARRRGQRVVLATSQSAAASQEFALHLGAVREEFDLLPVSEAPLSMREIADTAREADADRVVVPDGDRLTMQLGRSRDTTRVWQADSPPIALLVMRDHGQDAGVPALAPLKTLVKAALMRRAEATPGVRIVALKPSGWKGRSRISVAIDPVTLVATENDRASALDRLVAAGGADTRWLGVFGALTTRKNLPMIADALAESGRTDLGLVVLGHFDEGVRDICQPYFDRLISAGHAVLIEDAWLADGELDAFVGAVDCVVLAYSNEGPSGLLGKSITSGTRVLTAGARMLRQETRRYPGRAVWTPLTSQAMSRAISLLPTTRSRHAVAASDVEGFASPFLDLEPGDVR